MTPMQSDPNENAVTGPKPSLSEPLAEGQALPSFESHPATVRNTQSEPSHMPDLGTLCLGRATAQTNFCQISRELSASRARRRSVRQWFVDILRS